MQSFVAFVLGIVVGLGCPIALRHLGIDDWSVGYWSAQAQIITMAIIMAL